MTEINAGQVPLPSKTNDLNPLIPRIVIPPFNSDVQNLPFDKLRMSDRN
jgi:hypothetical protein